MKHCMPKNNRLMNDRIQLEVLGVPDVFAPNGILEHGPKSADGQEEFEVRLLMNLGRRQR